MATVDENAHCAIHPAQRALDVCARCGNYICHECREEEDFETYCRDCFRKVSKRSPHSTRATVAIVCGIIGINGCIPLGIAAVLLGHMELAAIERGESPVSGRNLAKGGMILGYIGSGLFVLGALFFFLLAMTAGMRHF